MTNRYLESEPKKHQQIFIYTKDPRAKFAKRDIKKHSLTFMNSIPKGFQNGAKIDADTHQKSMQKLVSKKKGN